MVQRLGWRGNSYMVGSIADALGGTGMIPAIPASQLNPPGAPPASPPESASKTAQDIVNKGDEELKPLKDKAAKDANAVPVLPTVENGGLKSQPKPDTSNDPTKGWISTIGVLGAIGSMFTRRPMTNSMNAAAAALNSMKAGEAEDFKNKMEAWKTENDNAFKLLDYQQNIYKSILENDRLSVEEKRAEIGAHASAFKDDIAADHMKNSDLIGFQQLQIDRDKAADAAKKNSAELEELGHKNLAFMEAKKQLDADKASGKITPQEYIRGLQAAAYSNIAAADARRSSATDKAKQKTQEGYTEAVDQINDLISMAKKGGGLGVTGLAGLAERGKETIETMTPLGANAKTPASDFQSKLDALKLELPKLLTGTSKSAADERSKVDQILRGTSAGDTQAKTTNALKQLKEIVQKRMGEPSDEGDQAYSIGDIVTDSDGGKHRITGFDDDGTPLGDPVK